MAKGERLESKDPEQLADALSKAGVEAVALTYVDNSGITRVKGVPTAKLAAAVASGVGMSPVFDVFVLDDSVTASETSTGPVGDLRLHPDLSRLVKLAAQPGWAWAPVDRRTQTGEPHTPMPAQLRRPDGRASSRSRARGIHELRDRMGARRRHRRRPRTGDCRAPPTG